VTTQRVERYAQSVCSGADAYRRLIAIRGERSQTEKTARWLTQQVEDSVELSGVEPATSRAWLGATLAAVTLDLHDGLAADVLGRAHGMIRGGGALILRMPERGESLPSPGLELLQYPAERVGHRFWQRLEHHLAKIDCSVPTSPLNPVDWRPAGTRGQAQLVQTLENVWSERSASLISVLADRGRGKSAALGMALGRAARQRSAAGKPLRAIVSAPNERAADELREFLELSATASDRSQIEFVSPVDLAWRKLEADLVVLDEAAQIPVPLLRRIADGFPDAHLAFATTANGYEGTGRGYVLRFLSWLKQQPRTFTSWSLSQPIRWLEGDPLERFVSDVLCLQVEIPTPANPKPAEVGQTTAAPVQVRRLEASELADNQQLLQEAFGLLVHAHYRTTPGDLQRMLDAPNLSVHAAFIGDTVAGVTLVASEGRLDARQADDLMRGRYRIRGHALADTLATHVVRPDAAQLPLVRSVRIATHPNWRRRGIACRLVEHVHDVHRAEVFGTVFGATAELVEFRKRVGYMAVRLGCSRGKSTGEPAVVMLRAQSPRGTRLLLELRQELARNLPLQLSLLGNEDTAGIDEELRRLLLEDLPEPSPLGDAQLLSAVHHYVNGPQPLEAAIYAVRRFVEGATSQLGALSTGERVLVEGRVLRLDPWTRVAQDAGYPSVPAATRAIRRALGKLLERTV
jgi:tRNA(Met) cytidine acetyltransferase